MAASRIVGPRASGEQLKDPDQLIDSIETFIFDCDAISPWNGVMFWLDPTGVEKNIHEYVQRVINEGITKFSVKYRTDVKKFDKNNLGIRWIKSQCPCQPQNSKDCGYYVCRFMLETIQKRRQVIPDKYFGGANASFPQVKIDKLRDMWIEYVNEHKQVADEELDDGMNGI